MKLKDHSGVGRAWVRPLLVFGALVAALALAGCGSVGKTGQGAMPRVGSGPLQITQAGSYHALTLISTR